MKKALDSINPEGNVRKETETKGFWQRQSDKLKHSQFTCPLCREVFKGISALGSHLKEHCT